MSMPSDPDRSTQSAAAGCLSQFGLLVIVGVGAVSAGGLAMLLPPWVKVDCQRHQVLYWSEVVEDHDSSFAGYHWLLAGKEWQTERSEPAKLES